MNCKRPWEGYRLQGKPVFAFPPSFARKFSSGERRLGTRQQIYAAFQGGKTFCASFCASLIAGSRRAFLCVYSVWFVAGVLSEMHVVRAFAPCKAFLFEMFAFFRRLRITLDSEQPMLKENGSFRQSKVE